MGLFKRKSSSNSEAAAAAAPESYPPTPAAALSQVLADKAPVDAANPIPTFPLPPKPILKPGSAANGNTTVKPAVAPSTSSSFKTAETSPAATVDAKAGTAADATADAAAPAVVSAPKPPPKVVLTLDQIAQGSFVAYVLFQLMLFKFFSPRFFTTFVCIFLGLGIGMGLSYLFYKNKKRKRELSEVLMADPGVKGMQCLLKDMPSWVSYTESEKMEWMNKLLVEMWPYYDRAICQTIKETVEPMIAQYCPPTFKRIWFKQLTFGDAPFRIESMWVAENRTDEVVMEVGVRWCGDANITIAVDLPAGGDATRMCPKVSDISFVGNARIALKPLCNIIPGFGAAMVSLKSPPIVKFKLDFGAGLGGGYTAGLIRNFLDPLIRDNMVNMLVWPQRYVVHIIGGDEAIDKEIEKMQLRHVGVMRVTVDRCNNLKSYDIGGKSDPMVDVCIDPLHVTSTKCVKNSLNPDYGETFYLLVQEPTDQIMRIVVSDIDMINVASLKEGLSLNPFKLGQTLSNAANAVNGKEMMGRSMIQIRPICEQEGREVAAEYPLGRGEWSDLNGPGKGEGTVHLTSTYKSFGSITADDIARAKSGILLVDIMTVADLELTAEVGVYYVVVKVGKVEQRTKVVKGGKDYRFGAYDSSRFTFYDVDITEELKVKVREYSMMSTDDSLGKLDPIPVAEIADANDGQPGIYTIDTRPSMVPRGGLARKRCQLIEVDKGMVTAEARFVPHFLPKQTLFTA